MLLTTPNKIFFQFHHFNKKLHLYVANLKTFLFNMTVYDVYSNYNGLNNEFLKFSAKYGHLVVNFFVKRFIFESVTHT